MVSFLASSSSSNVLGMSWLMDDAMIMMSWFPGPGMLVHVPVSSVIVPSMTCIWVVELSRIVQLINRAKPVSLKLTNLRLYVSTPMFLTRKA